VSYSEILSDGTILGDIPSIRPGAFFRSRRELHDQKLHRGLQQGIATHGSSIVLSGGYVDDEDLGDVIIYTGEGGRDQNSGRQIADQSFDGGNKALAENHLNGIPIRVHRGEAQVPEIPEGYRYRYDGLYRVARYWEERGGDDFKIWRFRIEKLLTSDLSPLPEAIPDEYSAGADAPSGKETPLKRRFTVTRILRSTAVGEWVKGLHDFTCQICGTRLVTMAGAYAEACHIKPLGRPHNGPDTPENILCLCPNCHVLFDELALWINDDLSIEGRDTFLRIDPKHPISLEVLRDHRRMSGR
jgi:putative restriction endonuclease